MTRDEPPKINMWWCLLKNRTVKQLIPYQSGKIFQLICTGLCVIILLSSVANFCYTSEIDQLSLFFFMTIALEKSESVLANDANIWTLILWGITTKHLSTNVGVVYDMVAITNVLSAASKNSLLVINAFCGSDITSFITRIRQWMTFSLPEIISWSPCTTARKWTLMSRDIWCTVKSLGLATRQKKKECD